MAEPGVWGNRPPGCAAPGGAAACRADEEPGSGAWWRSGDTLRPTHPQRDPDGPGAGDPRLPTHDILCHYLERGLRVVGATAILWGGGAEVEPTRPPPAWPHRGPLPPGLTVACPPTKPHRGQDILAVAIKHKPLPVEGDHVALPVEGAGGRAVGALLARPLPPRAGAGGGVGCSGRPEPHVPSQDTRMGLVGDPLPSLKTLGTAPGYWGLQGGAAAYHVLQSVLSWAPRG